MATVRTAPNSPYWIARVRVWVDLPNCPGGGFWRKTDRSTKVPRSRSRKAAQQVADEMERIGKELESQPNDKEFWESRLAALMRASHVEPPRKRTTWEAAAKDFVASLTAGSGSVEQYTGQCAQFSRFLGVRARHDLKNVSGDDFLAFYKHLQSEGRSASTAQNAAKTVRRVLERAHILGFLDANVGKLHKLSGGNTVKRRPFTKEDLAAIFDHIAAHESPEWRTACLFGLYYGLRIGDAVGRRFEEITVENGVSVIRFVPEKKKRRGKEITLPLVGELENLKGRGRITPTLADIENPSKAFGKLLDRAKFKRRRAKATGEGRAMSDKTFHSFRHTINSLLVDTGADPRTRQLICDHEDANVAAGYTHASVGTMASAITTALGL